MKKLLSTVFFCIVCLVMFAQAPQKFSYQAVVRDAGNNLVASQAVGVRISILQGGANGSVVFMESQNVVTNANGLMTLQIGGGTLISGDMATIDWASGPYFLKTETDPNGGTNYTIEGTQQLLSVPYALYAGSTANGFSGSYNDLTDQPTIPTVPTNVSAFTNDAGYITTANLPTNVSYFANDAQYITQVTLNNELQGYATSADIPAVPTNVSAFTNDANYVTLGQLPTVPTNVSAFNNDAGYLTTATVQEAANIPTQVSAFENDAHYITDVQLQEILNTITTMQSTIDSMNQVIEDLNNQVNPPAPEIGAVTTSPVSGITASSAVAGGNVTADGRSEITARGVCWSTSANPTVADAHTTDGSGLGEFVSNVTGLASSTTYYLCAYATNEVGTAYGEIVSFTTEESCAGTIQDVENNSYNIVRIGSQCWMKENLRTTKKPNGTSITSGIWTPGSNSVATYGRLYSWTTVMNGASSSNATPSGVQGICPDGWHVPSDNEWKQMEMAVGMSQSDANLSGQFRGNIAAKLCGNTGWNSSAIANAAGNLNAPGRNSTGFSALPAGGYYGSYDNFGNNANFWSATETSSDYAYTRYLYSNNAGVYRYYYYKPNGYSVRCVRD
ncbi:MAG: fibrobacter succinogenes major paralogous domain-containing protein [Bacteroidales bacterium]|nr:fibrobacter succinogenes major paralogous domain-containing protein [Bacteroidales bacterium]